MKHLVTIFTILFWLIQPALFAQIISSPEPLCGRKQAKSFMLQQMNYPQTDLDQKKSGKVIVAFHVDEQGVAGNHRVVKTFSEQASTEAIHLVKLIIWNPGTINGLPSAMDTDYEINFSVKNYQRRLKNQTKTTLPQVHNLYSKSYQIFDGTEVNTPAKAYFDSPDMNIEKYIRNELVFPDQAKELEISGTVTLKYVIEKNGQASNIIIEKSVGGGCDNEAIRLIENMMWLPAIKDDSIVRSYASQNITFQFGERKYHEGTQY